MIALTVITTSSDNPRERVTHTLSAFFCLQGLHSLREHWSLNTEMSLPTDGVTQWGGDTKKVSHEREKALMMTGKWIHIQSD